MNPVKHVAIIMDGNGRWGLNKKKSRNLGHKAGLKTIEKILKQSIKNKIRYLTLYAFSTENWQRPKKEINFLFKLLEDFLINKTKDLNKSEIKLKIIGKKKIFSYKLRKLIKYSEFSTKNNNKLQLNLAINYGSKSEIVDSVKLTQKNKMPINEKNITNNLYTSSIPDPEILIRTGNTHRLSNFLLWQLSYAEIFFEKKLWPDFTALDYNKIINKFKRLKRNFGKI
jgi:undecaprenyl diphosphate synthase|tara:strand:+ start:237 stop:914 length:678 start_codon:yes stop_codon:yes gene_type:complete